MSRLAPIVGTSRRKGPMHMSSVVSLLVSTRERLAGDEGNASLTAAFRIGPIGISQCRHLTLLALTPTVLLCLTFWGGFDEIISEIYITCIARGLLTHTAFHSSPVSPWYRRGKKSHSPSPSYLHWVRRETMSRPPVSEMQRD